MGKANGLFSVFGIRLSIGPIYHLYSIEISKSQPEQLGKKRLSIVLFHIHRFSSSVEMVLIFCGDCIVSIYIFLYDGFFNNIDFSNP